MIDITGDEIVQLSDADLRTLVGLLCEAELRHHCLSTVGVTWGGHQDAKDGGVDVRVEISSSLGEDNFVSRSTVGFQVKKPDLARKAILTEMRPQGELRQGIKELAETSGAYIIVSGHASLTDLSLRNRRSAMREAVADCPDGLKIKLDFYDRGRIAAWVRSHPALILWVRDKIGQPIQAWKGYGNWSGAPEGDGAPYLCDKLLRLYGSAYPHEERSSPLDGINRIRCILHVPKSSVRLVGLSGVGKTRLLQALFDNRLGQSPLNQSQVFYCDVGDNPVPDPKAFAEGLVALQTRAILAIDNCPPDLHRRLTSVCLSLGSSVSLITVEHDIRDDQPEETEVFRLEPASEELIEELIRTRYPHISEVDAHTIARFSGGNARIAVAVANTVEKGGTLSNLRDEELFIRLFQQRHSPDDSLLRAAEVCSLVYSFDGENLEEATSELRLLASLVGLNALDLYRYVSILQSRGLVQQRGRWRAVLPQAMANRLAMRALERIPVNNILSALERKGMERLLVSFSRRLGYLTGCTAAVKVSERWFSDGGSLSDITNINEHQAKMLANIAPINPEFALASIELVLAADGSEAFFSRSNANYNDISRLLRSLAYDKALFGRAANLLCAFALSEKPTENYNSIQKMVQSLFYLYLSGTHATADQRRSIIAELFSSEQEEKVILGIKLLDAALEAGHFSSMYGFEFGSHSRDYGFAPTTQEDIRKWYRTFISCAVDLMTLGSKKALVAKRLLAKKLPGLWARARMYEELEAAIEGIIGTGPWIEGWLAIKKTIRLDGQRMGENALARLGRLEMLLKPGTLREQARLYALAQTYFDLMEVAESDAVDRDPHAEVMRTARSIGREVAGQERILTELISEVLSGGGYYSFSFGQGLADGAENLGQIWRELCEQTATLKLDDLNWQVMRGFLSAAVERDEALSEELLNKCVSDRVLARVYPLLAMSAGMNQNGIRRLKQSLELGVAPISTYRHLAYGGVHKPISDSDLCDLLRAIASREGGIAVSVDILEMRLNGFEEKTSLSESLACVGQELLLKYEFSRRDDLGDSVDYQLACIIKACFRGDSAAECTSAFCEKVFAAYEDYRVYSMDHVVEALAVTQPMVFLEVFFGDDVNSDHTGHVFREHPLVSIDDALVLSWCKGNPKARNPLVASAIMPYQKGKTGKLEWTSLAMSLVSDSVDPIAVLQMLLSSLWPTSWSGSRADLMQERSCLIEELKEHSDKAVAEWAHGEATKLGNWIRQDRTRELNREQEYERFE